MRGLDRKLFLDKRVCVSSKIPSLYYFGICALEKKGEVMFLLYDLV